MCELVYAVYAIINTPEGKMNGIEDQVFTSALLHCSPGVDCGVKLDKAPPLPVHIARS